MSAEKVKKSIFKRWWFWVLAVLIVIGIAGSLGNNDTGAPAPSAQNPTTTDNTDNATQGTVPNTAQDNVQAAPDAGTAAEASIKSGMYKIGKDLPAGEYMLISESAFAAYYQLSSDSTGNLESIVSNDNFTGNRYVTAAEGQYLEFRDAVGYPAAEAPVLRAEDGRYNEGMYKANRDIEPGEYKLVPDDAAIGSYVEIAKDSSGKLNSIISNDNFQTEKYITVSDGQYIKLVGCHLITA